MANQKDTIEKSLDRRPSADDLKEKNILHSTPSSLSPALQGVAGSLGKERTKNSLEDAIAMRPDKSDIPSEVFSMPDDAPSSALSTEAEHAMNAMKLEGKLGLRPVPEDLIAQNILRDTSVAPSIQAAQEEFKKAQISNSLNRRLSDRIRPSAQALVDQHILLDTKASPMLQQAQEDLKKAQISDKVQNKLDERPTRGELVDKNILKGHAVASGLVADAVALEQALKEDKLDRKIDIRPSMNDLEQRGMIKNQGLAPSLHAQQEQLAKAQTADSLTSKLKDRPAMDDSEVKKHLSQE